MAQHYRFWTFCRSFVFFINLLSMDKMLAARYAVVKILCVHCQQKVRQNGLHYYHPYLDC